MEYGLIIIGVIIRRILLLQFNLFYNGQENRKFETANNTSLMKIVKLFFTDRFTYLVVVVMLEFNY
ncbi:MAG TPA: hypothetical protein PLR88_05685 [Bacteroidales bacterium]|nr:hypothetical protein [Bacteroidales bacterium]